MCVRARARACVRACVRACARIARVHVWAARLNHNNVLRVFYIANKMLFCHSY